MRSEELDYQRALQAYLWAVPMVNAIEFWRALIDAGVSATEPSLLVFDRPLTPAPANMAAHAQMIYAFTILDLAETGPVVAEIPAGFLGNFWDFHHRGLEVIGAGASAQGGKFLLLPPGQDVAGPPGSIVVRSRTSKIFGGGRCLVKAGDSTERFIDLVASIRLYPLARARRPAPTRVILNRDRPFAQGWPKNVRYFDYVAQGLSAESDDAEDKMMCAMLAPLGIEPGKPVAADDRMRRILCNAAAAGAAMVTTTAFATRLHGRQVWPDRQWERNFFPTRSRRGAGTEMDGGEPAQAWYQVVGDGRYVFASTLRPGEAHWYSSSFHDREGSFLDGGHSYRFKLHAGQSEKLSWSMTLYDNRNRCTIDADSRRANLSAASPLRANADGSVDLWFAPRAPANTKDNWIKTIPGQGFFAMFRLFAPLETILDGNWKLNDIERVG
jgi:hypothetical protein